MSVPAEITRIKGLRNDIRSRLIQIGALDDSNADLEACRDAMANVSTLTLDHIAITTPPDKDTYSPGETFDPTGMIVTAYFVFGDTVINFNVDDYTYPTEPLELGTDEVTISYSFLAVTKTAVQEIGTLNIEEDLDDNSWETISWIAKRGLGSTYWNIGDRKAITLEGPVGDYLTLVHATLYVYILDFNHPENGVPDNNIIFGGFFTQKTGGKDVCLVDSKYGTAASGELRYNLNHSGVTYKRIPDSSSYQATYEPRNYGGWKGCDLRYDILGATDYKPSGYSVSGSGPLADVILPKDRTGYDATQAAIDSPSSKTLMHALPSDFRNVLRLRTHYTDNKGGYQTYDGSGQYVTATTDAISFLTEYEITGNYSYSSPSEMVKQSQMAYYANGGSTVKYKHNDTNTAAIWWTASPRYNNEKAFCVINSNGNIYAYESQTTTNISYGLSPVFKV